MAITNLILPRCSEYDNSRLESATTCTHDSHTSRMVRYSGTAKLFATEPA